jgi:PAS domain S-box-containing protein
MTMRWDELLKRDHEITERVFAAMEARFAAAEGPSPEQVGMLTSYLQEYVEGCHNKKEELHLFPRLEAAGMPRHGGPLAVMLQEHQRATALLARLVPLGSAYAGGDRAALAELRAAFGEYAALCKDHFWKENDILYPMAQRFLDDADGEQIVRGIEAVEASLGDGTRERYHRLAERIVALGELRDLSFGLDREVLAAILNALPVELSFIDHEDRVRYFSHEHGEKIFGRSRGAIGMAVQNCHPPKSLHLVNQILADFKAGRRDVAEFWIDIGGRKVHIRYWPVRDAGGRYLGTLETVQDITAIQRLSGERRLLDPAA